jgi:hypothetical protein
MTRGQALAVAFWVSLMIGGGLAVMVFFAKAQTQQRLDALPWWFGPLVGVAVAVVGSGIALLIRRRKKNS